MHHSELCPSLLGANAPSPLGCAPGALWKSSLAVSGQGVVSDSARAPGHRIIKNFGGPIVTGF
jgi:hypothetical protein